MKAFSIFLMLVVFCNAQSFAADAGKVFFVNLKDGAKIEETSVVKFGVKGMKISPAAQEIDSKTAGHHHLIIDGTFIPEGQPVPKDEKNMHFGKGETETKLLLNPGDHTLTLQFANGAHISYGEKLSSTIHVKVVSAAKK